MTELCETLFSELYIGRLMYAVSIALVLNTFTYMPIVAEKVY